MQIVKSPQEFQQLRKNLQGSIGFVPTMGNLHDGHASLLAKSKSENTITAISIFVNPTQFNNPDDFKHYPRTVEQDLTLAEQLGVDIVFLPTKENMYADDYAYRVFATDSWLTSELESKSRPGHFEGVLTVVMKLFLIIRPTRAYFGEKDYQQYQLIKKMAEAFFLDTTVVGCPPIRNENGLPLSSRNSRFTPEQFKHVQLFPKIFHADLSPEEITAQLIKLGFEVDYIEDYESRRFGAVKFAGVRLIDNVEITT
ncbi:MAG TPA: pantoate--beta-alanine ligase [Gammaproteobacteria bacterium]|nr:pantoate--beta-alanine ligase [Gammaproteobacteria bacterium]